MFRGAYTKLDSLIIHVHRHLAGGMKKNFGKIFHNRSQQAKGATQQAHGNTQRAVNA